MDKLRKSSFLRLYVVGTIFIFSVNISTLQLVSASESDKSCSSPDPITGKCNDEDSASNSENMYSKESNLNEDTQTNLAMESEIKRIENLLEVEIRKLTHFIEDMHKEMLTFVKFNTSLQFLKESYAQNHKDVLSVSEWLHSYSTETNDKIKYIYSMLQNLTDYKMISEYEMDKLKPHASKVFQLEENVKEVKKRMDEVVQVTTELDSRMAAVLGKPSEEETEKQSDKQTDIEQRMAAVEEYTKVMHETFTQLREKLENLEKNVVTTEKSLTKLIVESKSIRDTQKSNENIGARMEKFESRVDGIGKRAESLEETIKHLDERMSSSPATDDLTSTLKQDIDESLGKLESKLSTVLKDVRNNAERSENINEKLSNVEKETIDTRDKVKELGDELLKLKKVGENMKNSLQSKLVGDMATQSNYFAKQIKKEEENMDYKVSLVDKNLRKKVDKLDASIALNSKTSKDNEKDYKQMATNFKNHKTEIIKIVSNLQEQIELLLSEVNKARAAARKFEEKAAEANKYMSNETIVCTFICMGIVDVVLIIIVLLKKGSVESENQASACAVENTQVVQTNRNNEESEKSNTSTHIEEEVVSVINFNAKGRRNHKKLVESVFEDTNHDISITSLLVNDEDDVTKVSSNVVIFCIDSNEKINGADDIKWRTIQEAVNSGGEVFVILIGDGKQLTGKELVNGKLVNNITSKQCDLTQLVPKKRILSVNKEFTKFQKGHLLASIVDLL